MKYDAFISYRHSELDMSIAKKIHKGLETFKVPKSVAKIGGKSSIKRVFRDQEELPIGSDLGDNITSALEQSEFLVVICSPRTPQSYWVNKEISTFISLHGRDHVLAVLIEGEPDESFPKELLSDSEGNPVEPLAADVRGNNDKEINNKLKVELLRLAAPILHCNYDDLRQRHRERRIKKIAATVSSIAAVAAVLGIGFGIYSAKTAAIIKENYNQKLINQSKYLAETSMKLLESGDREAAILVALEAVGDKNNPRPYVAEAEYALSSALYTYDLGENVSMDSALGHELNVKEMDTDKESRYLTTVDKSDRVYLWDIASRKLINEFTPSLDKDGHLSNVLWANVFNDRLVICDEEYVRSFNLNGELLTEESLKNIVGYAFAKPDSSKLYIWGNEIILIYDLTEFKITASVNNNSKVAYGGNVLESRGGSTFWISLLNEDSEEGGVLAYDNESGKFLKEYKIPYNHIKDMAETPKGELVVVSGPYKRGAMAYQDNVISLDVYDTNSGLSKFSTKVTGTGNALGARINVMARSYIEGSDYEHNELILLVGSEIYVWNATSFEQKRTISFNNNVSSLLVSAGSEMGYVGLLNGDIEYVNVTEGTIYDKLTISTDKQIGKMLIRGGIIFINAYNSTEVTLLTSHEGSSKKEVCHKRDIIGNLGESDDGRYYVIAEPVPDGTAMNINRYLAANDEEDASVTVPVSVIDYEDLFYLSEDECFCLDYKGVIHIVDFKKGSNEDFVIDNLDGVDKYAISNNHEYMAFNNFDTVILVDVANHKIVNTFKMDDFICAMAVSDDGAKVFAIVENKGLSVIDVTSGSITQEATGKYKMLNLKRSGKAIDISGDGKKLAVACSDDILRVMDISSMNTLTETSFVYRTTSFVKFMKDSDNLMLQGDDGVIRVFSVAKQELVYKDMKATDEIRSYYIDENNNSVVLVSLYGMVIKDLSDYSTKTEIEKGTIYLSKAKAVLVHSLDELYRFDLLSIDELAQSARQTVGRELTVSEKVKYHID